MLYRLILIVAVLISAARSSLAQGTSVLAYGADPTGTDDSAKAFRDAYHAVLAAGGGVVFIPRGLYKFDSKDDDDASTHLLIAGRNVSFIGESPAPTFGFPANDFTTVKGVSIFSTQASVSVFRVHAPAAPPPANVHFANIRIDRQPTAAGGGDGVRFSGAYVTEITDVSFTNVNFRNQYNGIRVVCLLDGSGIPTATGRVRNLRITRCHFENNQCNGITLEEFNELSVSQCQFIGNGCDGIQLEGRTNFEGTAYINACSVGGNARGISVSGIGVNMAQDIHITGCQIDANRGHGVIITQAKNVNITGCSVTANAGQGHNGELNPPPLNYFDAGLFIWDSSAVSVSGTTIQCNFGRGVDLLNSTGVAVSGCAIRCNNQGLGTYEAMRISGGRNVSLSALSFFGADRGQTRGIRLSDSPFGVVGAALTFDTGMIAGQVVYGTNVAAGKGSVSYFDPTSATMQTFTMP